MFSEQSVYSNPLIATFQLSSASSLNLGRSQNGVLGNRLKSCSIATGRQLEADASESGVMQGDTAHKTLH